MSGLGSELLSFTAVGKLPFLCWVSLTADPLVSVTLVLACPPEKSRASGLSPVVTAVPGNGVGFSLGSPR